MHTPCAACGGVIRFVFSAAAATFAPAVTPASAAAAATASTSTAVVPAAPRLPDELSADDYRNLNAVMTPDLLQLIFRYLDETGLQFVEQLFRWRAIARPLLESFVPAMVAYGSTTSRLDVSILGHLRGATRIDMAVDQFSPPDGPGSLLEHILTNGIQLNVTLGTPNPRMQRQLELAGNRVELLARGSHMPLLRQAIGRMHNKIWVIDSEGVILGSPNVTFSGLGGANLESCIYIRSARVGRLFASYLECLKPENAARRDLLARVSGELALYNSQQHQLRVALAPIVNITDFIVQELAGATKIIIRQFLISPKQGRASRAPGNDILATLCGMAQRGVEIEVYIDEGAYNTQGFVRDAVAELLRAGCLVFTQKPVLVVDMGHEAIQHDKLILATLHGGVVRTLIGSAGMTVDVIANANAENFISTDVQSIHETLMAHHRRSLDPSVATTKRWVLPPSS